MSYKIQRNDVYARQERGGEWADEFFRIMAKNPTTKNILDTINQKRGETVESVVSKYREAVGLDAFADDEREQGEIVAEASQKETVTLQPDRPLSIRQAAENADEEDVLYIIQADPKVKAELESLLESSDGTKNTHSIVNFLREMLGNDKVSFADDRLIQYIDDMKGQYGSHQLDDPAGQAGYAGTEDADYFDDNKADYVEHGKGV